MRDENVRALPAESVPDPTQLGSAVCHAGIASNALQPLPVPSQAVSSQPRFECWFGVSSVPPTATTLGNAAGISAP